MRMPLPTGAVVAVIGAGAIGAGIAQIAAPAGHPLLLRRKLAGGRTFHAA